MSGRQALHAMAPWASRGRLTHPCAIGGLRGLPTPSRWDSNGRTRFNTCGPSSPACTPRPHPRARRWRSWRPCCRSLRPGARGPPTARPRPEGTAERATLAGKAGRPARRAPHAVITAWEAAATHPRCIAPPRQAVRRTIGDDPRHHHCPKLSGCDTLCSHFAARFDRDNLLQHRQELISTVRCCMMFQL